MDRLRDSGKFRVEFTVKETSEEIGKIQGAMTVGVTRGCKRVVTRQEMVV